MDLPVASFGRVDTVTLNRARRIRPERTKNVRRIWSTGVRRPMAKAAEAGAAPKEICSSAVRRCLLPRRVYEASGYSVVH